MSRHPMVDHSSQIPLELGLKEETDQNNHGYYNLGPKMSFYKNGAVVNIFEFTMPSMM
jgi:hypothetical protein